jgi:hypothetical protein
MKYIESSNPIKITRKKEIEKNEDAYQSKAT